MTNAKPTWESEIFRQRMKLRNCERASPARRNCCPKISAPHRPGTTQPCVHWKSSVCRHTSSNPGSSLSSASTTASATAWASSALPECWQINAGRSVNARPRPPPPPRTSNSPFPLSNSTVPASSTASPGPIWPLSPPTVSSPNPPRTLEGLCPTANPWQVPPSWSADLRSRTSKPSPPAKNPPCPPPNPTSQPTMPSAPSSGGPSWPPAWRLVRSHHPTPRLLACRSMAARSFFCHYPPTSWVIWPSASRLASLFKPSLHPNTSGQRLSRSAQALKA